MIHGLPSLGRLEVLRGSIDGEKQLDEAIAGVLLAVGRNVSHRPA
jgi:hypothetical protein